MTSFSLKSATRFLVTPLIALISGGIVTAYINHPGSSPTKSGALNNSLPEHVKQLQQEALAHSSQDQLPALLRDSREISLQGGPPLKALSRLRAGSDGALYVVDAFTRKIEKLDSAGRFVLSIAGENSGPGHAIFPSDIDVGAEGLFVSDFKQTRISRFSLDGQFLGSFSTSAERFSAKNVFSTPEHDLWVCGNRYGSDTKTVHRYSAGGEFLTSLLPMSELQRTMNLDAFNDCLVASSPAETMLAFPYEYKIYRVTDGAALPIALKAPADFREPRHPLVFAGHRQEEFPSIFETWKSEWTPVENIARFSNGLLAIQYRTYNPLRYSVDVWDVGRAILKHTLHTNYRLLTTDAAGRVYFERMTERGNDSHELLIGRLEN